MEGGGCVGGGGGNGEVRFDAWVRGGRLVVSVDRRVDAGMDVRVRQGRGEGEWGGGGGGGSDGMGCAGGGGGGRGGRRGGGGWEGEGVDWAEWVSGLWVRLREGVREAEARVAKTMFS